MIGVNQSSCAKPALVNKSTAALSERINIFVLLSCLCILVGERKRAQGHGVGFLSAFYLQYIWHL